MNRSELPFVCPLCGAACAAKIVCPCEKFERLLAAAKNLVIGMKTGLDCAPFWTELIKEVAAIEAAKEEAK